MKTERASNSEYGPHCACRHANPLRFARGPLDGAGKGTRHQQSEGWKDRQNVFGKLRLRQTEKDHRKDRPASDKESRGGSRFAIAEDTAAVERGAREKRRPRQQAD